MFYGNFGNKTFEIRKILLFFKRFLSVSRNLLQIISNNNVPFAETPLTYFLYEAIIYGLYDIPISGNNFLVPRSIILSANAFVRRQLPDIGINFACSHDIEIVYIRLT